MEVLITNPPNKYDSKYSGGGPIKFLKSCLAKKIITLNQAEHVANNEEQHGKRCLESQSGLLRAIAGVIIGLRAAISIFTKSP